MQDNYASFARFTPGPADIFNYNIGNLWLNGIDGTGTTDRNLPIEKTAATLLTTADRSLCR